MAAPRLWSSPENGRNFCDASHRFLWPATHSWHLCFVITNGPPSVDVRRIFLAWLNTLTTTPTPTHTDTDTRRQQQQRETYKLEAMAQDKGYPPLSRTVEVQIDVVDRANNPPVWDSTVYGPIYVKENMPVGGKVLSIKARSVPMLNFLFSVQFSFFAVSGVSFFFAVFI